MKGPFGLRWRDKRWPKYLWQKITRGYADCELWNLDVTIAEFILPRLKTFTKQCYSYPGWWLADNNTMTSDEKHEAWLDKLEEMVEDLEDYLKDPYNPTKEKANGELFAEIWPHLWN